METDTVSALFPHGLTDYLKGKTEPNALDTDIAPGEQCKNEPNEPGAACTTSHEPQATNGREAPKKSRAEAARENGRKSRGPKTPEGKARSSQNALKHGLTARHVTINSEEEEEWESFLAACREELQPVGVIELSYADEFASSRWRLRRCLGIETVIFDDEFAHQETEIQKYKLIDDVGRTGLAFKKAKEDLNALGRYETRIRRAGERALANLLKLKQLRQNEPNDPERDSEGDPEADTLRVSPPAPETPETPCSTDEVVAAEPCPATETPEAKRTQATRPSSGATSQEPTSTAPAKPPLPSAFGILHSSVPATTDSCSSPSA